MPDLARNPERKRLTWGVGIGWGLLVTAGNLIAFAAAILRCRSDNQGHHPSACRLSDDHAIALFLLGILAPGGLIGAFGLLRLRITWLAAVWISAWTFWLGYDLALALT